MTTDEKTQNSWKRQEYSQAIRKAQHNPSLIHLAMYNDENIV